MFIDQDWKKESDLNDDKSNNFVALAILFFLAVSAFSFVFIVKFFNKPITVVGLHKESATTTETGKLPIVNTKDGSEDLAGATSTNGIKAEYLTFGHFYKKEDIDFKPNIDNYELPINVKVDVDNYYDVSRKINLDSYIEDFNNNGFAIINEKLFSSDNFYTGYKELLKNQIPILLTTDFLLYYNQNHLNQVFKEIEKNIFYENLWDINKSLFDISLTRYKRRLNEVGVANDPVLEGIRLEMAYFAVALNILHPKEDQINDKQNLVDESKFSLQDVEDFSFIMPDYLKTDVLKEFDLIYKASGEAKSPIFLYFKNYDYFKVPEDYSGNAKLNNFYLALKWLNSVFPLYYRSEGCPNCLLDYDDWNINMIAANFISKDVYDNEDIKSKWANIYKFVSFFSGLRSDLTYLQYHEALTDLFGEEYSIEDIFSKDNINRDGDIIRLRNKILEFNFSALEGSFDREKEKNRLGMRMLQENYWPNVYIFNSLIGNDLRVPQEKIKGENLITACKSREYYQASFRCSGFGMDVLGLIHPDVSQIDTKKYLLNTQYENYSYHLSDLRNLVGDFDQHTWNNNVYWSTLDISRAILLYDRGGQPVAINSNAWTNKKDINTILGAWVNLHLQQDRFVNYFEEDVISNFGEKSADDFYNFVEPNLEVVDTLIAKNDMLLKMFFALQLTKKTNIISIQLKDLNDSLKNIRQIIVKELKNEELTQGELDFIVDFSKLYFVKEKGEKKFDIKFELKEITESIDGIKFVALIYNNNGKKIMVVGPIFNYQEN